MGGYPAAAPGICPDKHPLQWMGIGPVAGRCIGLDRSGGRGSCPATAALFRWPTPNADPVAALLDRQ